MKTLAANRAAALKDMRATMTAIRDAKNRLEIYRACERLSAQALWLRDMAASSIARRGTAYPEHDWEYYRDVVEEEHGRPA